MLGLGDAVLQTGIVRVSESAHGPFEEIGSTKALSYPLKFDVPLRTWLTTGGDDPSGPTRSNLVARVNGELIGPSHTLHDAIFKEGAGRYSHWTHTLMFSLPAGVANEPQTVLSVKYSPQLDPMIKLLAAALFGTGALLTWLFSDPLQRARMFEWALPAVGVTAGSMVWASRGLLVLIAAYLASCLLGMVDGYRYPLVAAFDYWHAARDVSMFAPKFHFLILAFAAVGAMLAWLAYLRPAVSPAYDRCERAISSLWLRFGWVIIIGAFLFSTGSLWAGVVRPEDVHANAFAGIVPLADAQAHYLASFEPLLLGGWGSFAERRPFAAAQRSLLMLISGHSNAVFLSLQATLVGLAVHLAFRSVVKWRGIWAGLTFLALAYGQARPFIATNLTEPFGLFWALVAVPMLIGAIRRFDARIAIAGFLATALSLFTRMGSMFSLPALAIWMFGRANQKSERIKITLGVVLSIVFAVLLSNALGWAYGNGRGTLGGNFSLTLCGLAHGGNWSKCATDFAEQLREFNANEGEEAKFLYRITFEKIHREPGIFLTRIGEGAREFLEGLPRHMISGWFGPSPPDWFPVALWYGLILCGLFLVHGRYGRPMTGERAFWLWSIVGLLSSAPLLIFDEGWRVLSGAFVLVALGISTGFSSPRLLESTEPALARGAFEGWVLASGTILVLLSIAIAPFLFGKLDPLELGKLQAYPSTNERTVVAGGSPVTGILVLPNGAPKSKSALSIDYATFERIVKQSQIEQYQTLVTGTPYVPPFAFVVTPGVGGGRAFITPAEVVLQPSVHAWHLNITEWKQPGGRFWYHATSADPIRWAQND